MFYQQRQHYHSHGLFFLLSLIAAFFLGRKSEQYGYAIVSRGNRCCSDLGENDEMDMTN
ncbi:hypothetical protein REC12_24850 [Desulfosporosinus sp. PR]|uniref:hypothetical protein n=1 Tax=Candidatus Desulfosporosinus nitrosoreducens TaxID=3401928 RepID=UPI0027FAC539|nr:hypothetical protein [Desulfosporosinus sp. PR]MDQ7096827.1 hypothetical protein [Desulfosporosinus sp. PR]